MHMHTLNTCFVLVAVFVIIVIVIVAGHSRHLAIMAATRFVVSTRRVVVVR